jgi:hypothetical protein
MEVIGGRGVYSLPVSGTSAGVTGVQRRWVDHATGTPLAGALGTWTATTFNSGTGAWSFADVLPWSGAACTQYRLELRNPTGTVTASQAGLWIGTNVVMIGQSGNQLIWSAADGVGTNAAGLQAVAGAVGQIATVNDQEAGATGAYVQPSIVRASILGGTTPSCNQGSVAFVNEWHQRGGGPVKITQSAIQGTGAAAHASDAPYEGWSFVGTKGIPAPTANGNSGGVGFHGYMSFDGRSVADAYLLMWMPGIGGTQSEAIANIPALWAMLDPLWNVKVPLKLVAPPYKITVVITDPAHLLYRRQEPRNWAVTNDAIMGVGAGTGFLMPQVSDILMGDPGNGLHPSNSLSETDANGGSVRRIGASYGRAAAAAFDASIDRIGPQPLAAWLEAGGAQMVVEFGKRLTTLAGAPPSGRSFQVSTDGGTNWTIGLGPTNPDRPWNVTLEGTRARLTRTSGVWTHSPNLRVAVLREFRPHKSDGAAGAYVNEPAWNDSESFQRGSLNGMIYALDGAGWRFGASGAQPGWPICPTDYNGIAVSASKPAPALVLSHPLPPGAKTVTLRAFGTGLPPGGQVITLPASAVVS